MNMKTTILFALVSILLSSCSSKIYQVTHLEYTGENPGITHNSTEHDHITIQYYFWDEGGQLGFTVTNNLAQPVLIDFSQSSLIVNGKNYPYVRGQSVTSFQSTSEISLINEVTTSGVSHTQHDENRVFIAPNSEMHFQKIELDIPYASPQSVKSHETITVEMPQNLSEYSFRHFLSYSLGGKIHFADDSFKVVSTDLVGPNTFTKLDQKQTGNELSVYRYLSQNNSGGAVWGSIMVASVLVILIVNN